MRDEWTEKSLGEVTLKIGSGATPRGGKSVYVGSGAAFIRSQNVYDRAFSAEQIARINTEAATQLEGVAVEPNDVLICITGESVTRTCLVPTSALPARVSQHVAIVRPDPLQIDPQFLLSALLDPPIKSRLNQLSEAGATRRALTKSHLQNTRIMLPPIGEQRRIAAVLGGLDDLIDANQKIASDAVALACAIAAAAPTIVALDEIATESSAKSEVPNGIVDHFSLPAFDDGGLPEQVDGSTIKSNKLRISEAAVLVSRLNPHIPRVWMVYPGAHTALASTEFVPLGPRFGVAPEEIWAVCATPAFMSQMAEQVTGTTGSHQRVDKKALVRLQVPDVRKLTPNARGAISLLVRETHACRTESATLKRVRDELLPLLMSGAVTPGTLRLRHDRDERGRTGATCSR